MNVSEGGTLRFAAIISHPIQHFAPLFRRLAERPGLRVRVFYCCDWGVRPYHDPGFDHTFAWDVPLLDGYEYEFLPLKRRPTGMGFWDVDNPKVGERLSEYRPHVIWLHGYGQRTCWRAARWARGRAAILHFGDSELVHVRAAWRRVLKRLVLGRYFRDCDAFITIGDRNEGYYREYGVSPRKFFRGAYPIDLARFRTALQSGSEETRTAVRRRFGLPSKGCLAIQAGKLQPIKRPLDFVEALALLRDAGVPVWGLLVGDGPMRPQLEILIRERRLQEQVKISGFVNQAEMPQVLSAGDMLVSSSEKDPHPLVVTEGLSVGLPIIASDRIGCIGPTDTARPGVNALIFRCGDVPSLAESMRRLVEDDALRRRMGAESWNLASSQDAQVTAEAVCRAIDYLRSQKHFAFRTDYSRNGKGPA